jgi:hypothetical protein
VAPRNKLRTTVLRSADYGLRALKTRMGGRRGRKIERVVYYPPVSDAAVLGDLVNRAAWYLPPSAEAETKIDIPVTSDLRDIDVSRLASPDCQTKLPASGSDRIRLGGDDEPLLSEADVILVWNKNRCSSREHWPISRPGATGRSSASVRPPAKEAGKATICTVPRRAG